MRHDGGTEDDAADDFGDDAGLANEGERVVEEATEGDDYDCLWGVSSLHVIKYIILSSWQDMARSGDIVLSLIHDSRDGTNSPNSFKTSRVSPYHPPNPVPCPARSKNNQPV